MPETIKSKVELANIAGVPVGGLVAAGEILQKIITYIGQNNAKLEGEALKTFSTLFVGFMEANKNNYQAIEELLSKSYEKIDQRSIIYISKMLAEIEKLNLQERNKVDIYKYIIDKRAEIEKLEKERNADIAKWVTILGGSMALAAVIFVGYKYARPKTIGDFLDKLL
jgi:hypothetical protein